MLPIQLKSIFLICALLMTPLAASAQSTNPATDMNPDTAARPHENELSGSDEPLKRDWRKSMQASWLRKRQGRARSRSLPRR